jgi:O-antigen/teichoic acid export membrane protein
MTPFMLLLNRNRGALAGLGHVWQGLAPDQLLRPVVFVTVLICLGAELNVEMALIAQSVALAAACLVGVIVLQANCSLKFDVYPSLEEQKQWTMSLFPLSGVAAVTVIASQSDIAMLALLASLEDVATFRIASQVATIPALVMTVFVGLAGPRISALVAAGQGRGLQVLLTRMARTTCLAAVSILIMLALFGRAVIVEVFGDVHEQGYAQLLVLSFGVAVAASCGLVTTVLKMSGHARQALRWTMIAAVSNVFLNALLIPQLGGLGAAIATALSLVVAQLGQWRAVLKTLNLRADAFASPSRAVGAVP